MKCVHCNSDNITTLKIHITNPVGAKKNKCLNCNKTFMYIPPLVEKPNGKQT